MTQIDTTLIFILPFLIFWEEESVQIGPRHQDLDTRHFKADDKHPLLRHLEPHVQLHVLHRRQLHIALQSIVRLLGLLRLHRYFRQAVYFNLRFDKIAELFHMLDLQACLLLTYVHRYLSLRRLEKPRQTLAIIDCSLRLVSDLKSHLMVSPRELLILFATTIRECIARPRGDRFSHIVSHHGSVAIPFNY